MKEVDKILNIEPPLNLPMDINEGQWTKENIPEDDDIENDYKYQRENFYNLVERGQNAVEGILELAKESDHPEHMRLLEIS